MENDLPKVTDQELEIVGNMLCGREGWVRPFFPWILSKCKSKQLTASKSGPFKQSQLFSLEPSLKGHSFSSTNGFPLLTSERDTVYLHLFVGVLCLCFWFLLWFFCYCYCFLFLYSISAFSIKKEKCYWKTGTLGPEININKGPQKSFLNLPPCTSTLRLCGLICAILQTKNLPIKCR